MSGANEYPQYPRSHSVTQGGYPTFRGRTIGVITVASVLPGSRAPLSRLQPLPHPFRGIWLRFGGEELYIVVLVDRNKRPIRITGHLLVYRKSAPL